MSTLVFNNVQPPYQVHWEENHGKQKVPLPTHSSKIERIALYALKGVECFFEAFARAAYETFRHSGTSFQQIVLGYYGPWDSFRPPEDIYLAVFKVAIWALGLAACLTLTTGRLFLQRMREGRLPEENSWLSSFCPQAIAPHHFTTTESELDASTVPPEVQVDTLKNILRETNFDKPNESGYLAPTSRMEGSTTYSKEELQSRLDTFIERVNQRMPFIATPPSYDTPRLMAFYQHIENAVRLSIHKAEEELRAFLTDNPLSGEYTEEQKRKYDDLLIAKSRIALDLAIAAGHCGSRYMSEATTIHHTLCGENISNRGQLSESLIEVLAHARLRLARGHIEKLYPNDPHGFSNYMSRLGELLGLPGARHISENYASKFEYNAPLNLFFAEYTEDAIIDAVQEAIKSSQVLREQIADWVKERVGDWNAEKDENEKKRMLEEIASSPKTDALLSPAKELSILIEQVGVPMETPVEQGWDDRLASLLNTEQATTYLQKISPQNWRLKKYNLKQTCAAEKLDPELTKALTQRMVQGTAIDAALLEREQEISRLQKLTHLTRETLKRVVEGKAQLKEVLQEHLRRERSNEFMQALGLQNMKEEGVSPAVMEWLLVSHHIFNPPVQEDI